MGGWGRYMLWASRNGRAFSPDDNFVDKSVNGVDIPRAVILDLAPASHPIWMVHKRFASGAVYAI